MSHTPCPDCQRTDCDGHCAHVPAARTESAADVAVGEFLEPFDEQRHWTHVVDQVRSMSDRTAAIYVRNLARACFKKGYQS